MGAIAREVRQYGSQEYEIYVLSSNLPAGVGRVEVVPSRGGMITRWSVDGQELLYLDEQRFADPNLSVRGGIPILFPICGNLPGNRYTLNGQSYELKQHGFARDCTWQAASDVNQGAVTLLLVLESNDQTRAVYPFDFQFTLSYTLFGNVLSLRQRLVNTGNQPMPYSMGFHPYFTVDDKSQLTFEIPAATYQDQKTGMLSPFTGSFDFSREELDFAFKQVSGPVSKVGDRQRDLELTLECSEEFSTLVFWTLRDKPFYCLEPWSAPRNAINTGESLLTLEPGEGRNTFFNLGVEFGMEQGDPVDAG
jgi:galactose mutarotase-like enzyme